MAEDKANNVSNESNSSNVINDNTIDDLKEMIINWLSLDDKIKEVSATVKDLNLEKKQFESYILDYMTKLNKPIIDTSSGKLIKNDTKTKKALKEDMVIGALTEITGDKVKASEFTKFIFDKRPEVENTRLKRMKLPVPKKNGKTVI
jgi:hypothetical protein